MGSVYSIPKTEFHSHVSRLLDLHLAVFSGAETHFYVDLIRFIGQCQTADDGTSKMVKSVASRFENKFKTQKIPINVES